MGWPGSPHYETPQAYTISIPRERYSAYPEASERQQSGLSGTGILTCCPFISLQLGTDLGSTNPQLTSSAEETFSPSGDRDSYPALMLLPAGFSLPVGPLDL